MGGGIIPWQPVLTAVRDILRQAARTLGIEPAVYLVRAREVWPQVVGPILAAGGTEPRSLRGNTVVVVATHALVAQEVRLRREEILESLRRYLPEAGLRELRVIIRQGAGRGGG